MQRKTYRQAAGTALGILIGFNLVWLINSLPIEGENPVRGHAAGSLLLLAIVIIGLIGADRSGRRA